MRKVILVICTVLLAILLIVTLTKGLQIGNCSILSYSAVEKKSDELNELIASYETKNSNELPSIQSEIKSEIENYNTKKQEYEELLAQKQANLMSVDNSNCYDVDFLWTKIGNYATTRGLDLEFNITRNSSSTENKEYLLADLNFSLSGEYDQIANFINDLENDEKLEFEIRNFQMSNENSSLKAKFVVYKVAINQETLTKLTSSEEKINDTNK